jgi:2',3'-cyclic-nucleotide 2'-phosphodiesterase (5'-nucleotidase family)
MSIRVARLTLIHTNDMHGRLTPGAAARLRALVLAHPGAVLLDAGDAISAGNLGVRLTGEPILSQMSDLGYAAMTLGNRETHPRREIFPRKVDRARFPLLCANVRAKNGAPLPLRPSLVMEAGGIRLGLFGVTVPMFTRKQWSQPLCDYWFSPPIEAAAAVFEQLRPRVDVVVALTHIGFRQDLALADRLPELDLVIGGHSHTDLAAPHRVGQVPVLQARAFAFFAGVAQLEVTSRRAALVSWHKVALRDDAPAPPARES